MLGNKSKVLILFTAVVLSCGTAGNVSVSATEVQNEVETGQNITELKVTENYVEFDENSLSTIITLTGIVNDGTEFDITNETQWTTSDSEVAWVRDGDILAVGKGTAVITATYNGISKDITVKVNNYVDYESDIFSAYQNIMTRGVTDTVTTIMTRAMRIKGVAWTPEEEFKLRDGEIVSSGTKCTGVPYSQSSNQCNADEFIAAMSKSDFYDYETVTNSSGETRYNCEYGLDCSGLISKAWGISRKTTLGFYNDLKGNQSFVTKVGSYTVALQGATNYTQLYNAYSSLEAADALVYRNSSNSNGHAVLVISNDTSNKQVHILEAYYNFPSIRTYTYAQLATKGFLPFTYK